VLDQAGAGTGMAGRCKGRAACGKGATADAAWGCWKREESLHVASGVELDSGAARFQFSAPPHIHRKVPGTGHSRQTALQSGCWVLVHARLWPMGKK
jgi:hypothetical protein